jgi:subtilisin family serine protease
LLVIGSASPSQAEASKLTARQNLAPAERIVADKAPTSRLAKTDKALLNRTDGTVLSVVVKLDYDSTSTYAGGIAGLSATSPSVTGKALSGASAEQRYEQHITRQEDAFLGELSKRVKGAKVGQRLRTVYGGIAIQLPANKIADILAIKNVVAVQQNSLRKPLTDSSTNFIGANALYPGLGGKPNAGKGVIFGVLDTGAWPEHPSFADQGNLGAPPAKADGTPRVCNFGDNPLTPANDPFACNNKLIGGQPFLTTYLSDPGRAAAEPYHTARDSNGHGTHTGSTSAGNSLASAQVFGVERGPVNGVAPGAWVSVYKVCGIEGCFDSDSAAAVGQAIKDGVKVINFSISGGTDPFSDPVELAFLDAYAAGVFVSASAGNDGPGAGTANHLSPWVTTVAASTQTREFRSTLTVTGGASPFTANGASITAGAGPAPVVLSSAAPYSRPLCDAPAPAGSFTGKIVACQRGGNARVEKGFNVLQGGAVGMILYNLPPTTDVETDNHWLPTVHLVDGTQLVAYLTANPTATATFTAGTKANGQGDVMASFSSRGPAGLVIKPDVTAPGVQILAGHTPTPESPLEGPPGQYFQAIAGTSMSSPHTAGSAVLLKALHPTWTPGQIKSALMTTATTAVKKEDATTAADPFDFGAGRIRVNVAGNPGLTFDESAANMAALGGSPLTAVHLNIPSVNAPVLPGRITTVRKATNVSGRSQTYRVQTTSPAGSSISVQPSVFNVGAGATVELSITIRSSAPTGQYFGEVRLVPLRSGVPTLHLPVAFVPQQGSVTLSQVCDPTAIGLFARSTCTVTATNNSFENTTANLTTTTSLNLPVTGATNAGIVHPFRVEKQNVPLAGAQEGVPTTAPATDAIGYIPLDAFGVTPIGIGDEEILNFNVPAFRYNGVDYTNLGVDSNGYLIAGGGTSEDNNCCNLVPIPNPAAPNNVLAPYWTDLDGTGAPGIFAEVLTDGTDSWIVIEWRVNVFGTTNLKVFQVWLGVNGEQDITFAYDPARLPGLPGGGQDLVVGAENRSGTGGVGGLFNQAPTTDLRVTSTPPTPGASVSYTVTVFGLFPGAGKVTTSLVSPVVLGTTIVESTVNVSRRPGRFS